MAATVDTTAQFQTGPNASLDVRPNPAHPGETVVLDATESSAPGDDTIVDCEFDVDGDGTFDASSQECRIEHAYETAGEYPATVRVLTDAQQTATDTETVVVAENEPPRPAIAVEPGRPRPDEQVTLDGTDSTDVDGAIVEYRWHVAGRELTGETVATSFAEPGAYEVTLLVVDDDGSRNETATTVQVEGNRAPTAVLEADPREPTVGDEVTLDASESTDPDGAITTYAWDLDGDGSTDRTTEEPRTVVSATEPGQRAVQVTVIDDGGASDTAPLTFTVAAAEPTERPTAETETSSDEDGSGVPDPVDGGVVPWAPDWLVLLAVLVAVGGVGTVLRRREAAVVRLRRLRERLARGDVRRRVANKLSGFVSKTILKRVLRRVADLVEFSGRSLGDGFERLGRWIKRGSERLAAALRSLGG